MSITLVETFVGRKNDIESQQSKYVGTESLTAEGVQAIEDFNGDGIKDILTEKAIFFGDGTGEFDTIEREFPYLSEDVQTPYMVSTADFDNDGDIDIMVVPKDVDGDGEDETKYIIINPGDGEMKDGYIMLLGELDSSTAKTEVITPVDLNKDGLMDALLGKETGDIEVWMNPGDTSTKMVFEIPGTSGAKDITVADIDKDGVEDIIFVDGASVKYILGVGTPGVEMTPQALQDALLLQSVETIEDIDGAAQVEVADIDGSRWGNIDPAGEMDVVVGTASGSDPALQIVFGPLTGATTKAVVGDLPGLSVKDLDVVDVNRDGWLDVVAAFEPTGGAYYRRVFHGTNALAEDIASWAAVNPEKIGPDGEDEYVIEAMDFDDLNGDGNIDMVFSAENDRTRYVLGENVPAVFDNVAIDNQKERISSLPLTYTGSDGDVDVSVVDVKVEVTGPTNAATPNGQAQCTDPGQLMDNGEIDPAMPCVWHDSDISDCRFPGDEYWTVTSTIYIEPIVVPCTPVGPHCILLDPLELSARSVDNGAGEAQQLCTPEAPPPPPPPACPDCAGKTIEHTIYGITHGFPDSVFWETWGEGARKALPECTVEFVKKYTSYDVGQTVAFIEEACAVADAAIITVPFASDADKLTIAAAINTCTASKPDFLFELSNTDTAYDMGGETSSEAPILTKQWYGYAGRCSLSTAPRSYSHVMQRHSGHTNLIPARLPQLQQHHGRRLRPLHAHQRPGRRRVWRTH